MGDIILTEVNHLPTDPWGLLTLSSGELDCEGVESKKKRETLPVWASGLGNWVQWQHLMKQADMQESWSPSLECIMYLCMHHFSAQMQYVL